MNFAFSMILDSICNHLDGFYVQGKIDNYN